MRLFRLCGRITRHRWVKVLEPGVEECRVCRCLTFSERPNMDVLQRYLLDKIPMEPDA